MIRSKARRASTILVVALLSTSALAATWTWGVNPVHNWLDQRDEISQLEAKLAEAKVTRAALEADIQQLQTDAEIERIARRDLGLVYPGEEAYVINLSAEMLDPAVDPGVRLDR